MSGKRRSPPHGESRHPPTCDASLALDVRKHRQRRRVQTDAPQVATATRHLTNHSPRQISNDAQSSPPDAPNVGSHGPAPGPLAFRGSPGPRKRSAPPSPPREAAPTGSPDEHPQRPAPVLSRRLRRPHWRKAGGQGSSPESAWRQTNGRFAQTASSRDSSKVAPNSQIHPMPAATTLPRASKKTLE